jgi:hypothetical protein
MRISSSVLCPSQAPFYTIVLRATATPISQITLLVTFGTRENFHAECMQLEIADFETAYNAILRRSALIKFMAIPHNAYLVLKVPGLNDVSPSRWGSSINILFLKTFDQMRISSSVLCPSQAPFYRIVPRATTTPISQITLLVTFGTRENFHAECMQLEIADFETAYNAFLRRSALIKFMAIPHYAYLVLKVPGLNGVISIKGDVKCDYDCDRESCEMADMLLASIEL